MKKEESEAQQCDQLMSYHLTSPVQSLVLTSLFTALIAAGAYIAVPIGPVPLVMQNFFVLLAGLLLGPVQGLTSVATYLIMGALGIPVFAGGSGGIAHFMGPTGGYLAAYLPAVVIVGSISRFRRPTSFPKPNRKPRIFGRFNGPDSRLKKENKQPLFDTLSESNLAADFLAGAAGVLIIYAIGVPWLRWITGLSWAGAIGAGLLPFLPGDVLKIAAAAFTARALYPKIYH